MQAVNNCKCNVWWALLHSSYVHSIYSFVSNIGEMTQSKREDLKCVKKNSDDAWQRWLNDTVRVFSVRYRHEMRQTCQHMMDWQCHCHTTDCHMTDCHCHYYYLSHCYTIAWDRLSNQFFVCLCMYVCMYLWARLWSHFSTDLHEIW